jgi:Protein of unknown function (DUF3455)
MTKLVPAAIAAFTLFAGAAQADPAAVAPPAGAVLMLAAPAEGVQIYACDAKDQGFAWVFKAPEAALFDAEGRQILSHFAGPSWKSADGTTLVGEVAGKADAPAPGAIPWLLLKTKSHEGSGPLAKAGFIRRIDTKGGAAPAAGCDAGHAGNEARMRYSAVYEFYEAGK